MKPIIRLAAAAGILATSVLLTQSCSDPTTDESTGSQATIDLASVSTGITEMSPFIPICRTGSSQAPEATSTADEPAPALLGRLFTLRRDPAVQMALRSRSLPGYQPPDKMGDCGGRATYTSYSHSSGTTTGTYTYQNYCTTDFDTGERTTLNGSINFKDIGTPSPSGPITSKVEASSPDGITEITRNAAGQVISSKLVKFVDYEETVGVPGANPTSSSPDRLKAKELSFTTQATGKTYRQTDQNVAYFITPSGGEQWTISGRGHRSDGTYFDMSTTSPLTSNASGDMTGGEITFTGAKSSKAVLTIVPGSTLQGTMTVNGQPVTNVPICK